MNERVLIVDDEASVHDVVRAYLEREGFIVYSATRGAEGLEIALSKSPDLVVLDLMLPDISGEEICRQLRERSDVAIIMLTAKSGEEQRIAGLGVGADDYVVKPFSPRELVARIKAVLRRSSGAEMPLVEVQSFDDGRLVIDSVLHEVRVEGEPVSLTPSEYKLLSAIAQYPGRAYARIELVNRVQGHEFEGYERTIDAHVKNLRRKIESDPSAPHYVITVPGVGYRLGVRSE
ncbi:MAG: response regulator transcription factor [Thermoleophilaceae bacterium]|nr:response regulator transcription factor [Thermoleophilaceae bacterium]